MCKQKWKKENKESDKGNKPFCLCKWERVSRNTGVQAGHLGSVNPLSLLPFLSLHLTFYLSTPGPAIPLACSDSMRSRKAEEEVGIGCKQQGGRRDCQNIHLQAILAKNHPFSPSPKLFPTITESNSQCKLSETVGSGACRYTHLQLKIGGVFMAMAMYI